MLNYLLIVLGSTFTLSFISYLLLPEVLVHLLGIGSWKRQYSPGITLTFDDGPDPRYTPRILDKLAENQVKAVFFLVGEKARQNPDLVLRIQNEGHQIGAHCFYHKHAWMMNPLETWKLWNQSIKALTEILEQEPLFIRPPWGSMNLAFVIWSKMRGKKIILYNTVGQDWKIKYNPQIIIDHSLKKANEGTIVLLHDSGSDNGAPENTISALDNLCADIKYKLKLPILPLSLPDWSVLRRISFRLWQRWEHYYAKTNEVKRIDDSNLFRLARTKYKGPDLYDQSGKLIAKNGDWAGEIHLDSIRFQSGEKNLPKVSIKALKMVRRSLPNLTRYITEDADFKDVKLFFGRTMLNRGVKGLGFHVQENDTYSNLFLGCFQKVLMVMYHPAGLKRNTERLGNKPKLVWITRDTLVHKYLEPEDDHYRKEII